MRLFKHLSIAFAIIALVMMIGSLVFNRNDYMMGAFVCAFCSAICAIGEVVNFLFGDWGD